MANNEKPNKKGEGSHTLALIKQTLQILVLLSTLTEGWRPDETAPSNCGPTFCLPTGNTNL